MKQQLLRDVGTSNPITVSPDAYLSDAAQIMTSKKISSLIVVEDDRPKGIITERDIAMAAHRFKEIGQVVVTQIMSESLITAPDDMDIFEAYNLIRAHNIRHLVIVNREQRPVAVVSQSDIMKGLGLGSFLEMQHLDRIMTRVVLTIAPDSTVFDAVNQMDRHEVSCTVIEKGGYPVGILTERDIVDLWQKGIDFRKTHVKEVMSAPVFLISEQSTTYKAANLMQRHHIRRLVVVDGRGKLVGLVTQSDIFEALEKRYVNFLQNIIYEQNKRLNETQNSLLEKSIYLDNILRWSTDMAIMATDLDYRIIFYNPACEGIFGYKAEKVIGRSAVDLHVKKHADIRGFFSAIETVKKGGEFQRQLELELNGRRIFLEAKISGIVDKEGKLMGYVMMARDVTSQKRMEEDLLKAHKLESIALFAGGIAHDFNNLLTAVLGNVSLAKIMAEDQEDLCKRLSEAEKALLKAKDLTQKLLTFASGGAPVKKVVSLVETLRETADFIMSGSNIRCEYVFDDELMAVEVDRGQINQVVTNLLINAMQAMPEGGKIIIKATNTTIKPQDNMSLPAGRYVKISITDQGIGIPRQYLSKIFDPYFTTKQKGSGLGLAICHSIIHGHGGMITVDSEIGKGTSFHVYLPGSDKKVIANKDADVNLKKQGGRVLIMDDEEIILDVAGEILKFLGYEPAVARDGAEAIEIYKEAMAAGTPFDAVIFDLTVPGGMGGAATLKRLLELDPNVTAIVSSGYSNDPVMANYKDYGFKGIVSKPYQIEELGQVLEKCLSK